jgi:hypothetical protein
MGNVQYDGWLGVSVVAECSASEYIWVQPAWQFIGVATDLGTWRRFHYMLVVFLHPHDITHHFVKLSWSSRLYGSD